MAVSRVIFLRRTVMAKESGNRGSHLLDSDSEDDSGLGSKDYEAPSQYAILNDGSDGEYSDLTSASSEPECDDLQTRGLISEDEFLERLNKAPESERAATLSLIAFQQSNKVPDPKNGLRDFITNNKLEPIPLDVLWPVSEEFGTALKPGQDEESRSLVFQLLNNNDDCVSTFVPYDKHGERITSVTDAAGNIVSLGDIYRNNDADELELVGHSQLVRKMPSSFKVGFLAMLAGLGMGAAGLCVGLANETAGLSGLQFYAKEWFDADELPAALEEYDEASLLIVNAGQGFVFAYLTGEALMGYLLLPFAFIREMGWREAFKLPLEFFKERGKRDFKVPVYSRGEGFSFKKLCHWYVAPIYGAFAVFTVVSALYTYLLNTTVAELETGTPQKPLVSWSSVLATAGMQTLGGLIVMNQCFVPTKNVRFVMDRLKDFIYRIEFMPQDFVLKLYGLPEETDWSEFIAWLQSLSLEELLARFQCIMCKDVYKEKLPGPSVARSLAHTGINFAGLAYTSIGGSCFGSIIEDNLEKSGKIPSDLVLPVAIMATIPWVIFMAAMGWNLFSLVPFFPQIWTWYKRQPLALQVTRGLITVIAITVCVFFAWAVMASLAQAAGWPEWFVMGAVVPSSITGNVMSLIELQEFFIGRTQLLNQMFNDGCGTSFEIFKVDQHAEVWRGLWNKLKDGITVHSGRNPQAARQINRVVDEANVIKQTITPRHRGVKARDEELRHVNAGHDPRFFGSTGSSGTSSIAASSSSTSSSIAASSSSASSSFAASSSSESSESTSVIDFTPESSDDDVEYYIGEQPSKFDGCFIS